MTKKKKKTKRTEDDAEISTCTNCGELTLLDSDYCPVCYGAELVADSIHDGMKKNDPVRTIVGVVGSVVIQAGRPALQQFISNMANQGGFVPQTPGQRPARRQPPMNPWPVLGLDPKKATQADVKKMQRRLVAIYHPDKADKAVNPEMVKRINAAAEVAIAWLKEQGRT